MEIFKPIEGYDNYMVSTWGKVYVLKHIWGETKSIDGTREGLIPELVKVELKQHETKKGYMRVDLYKDGFRKHYKVHRLVAQAFIKNPDGKSQVNHKDGNKKNNSVTNLEWVTDAENKEHQKRMNEGVI